MAVECDGDRWHGANRYEEDMQRQRQLERCGWEFFRVPESAFYSNRENSLLPLWHALEEREIFPSVFRLSHDDEALDDKTIRDKAKEDDDEENDFQTFVGNNSADANKHPVSRADEVVMSEIGDAILQALSKCPNQACTIDSMTSRTLKELGILTRGNPWKRFEKRVMKSVDLLEERQLLEKYKAKNRRVRLLRKGDSNRRVKVQKQGETRIVPLFGPLSTVLLFIG